MKRRYIQKQELLDELYFSVFLCVPSHLSPFLCAPIHASLYDYFMATLVGYKCSYQLHTKEVFEKKDDILKWKQFASKTGLLFKGDYESYTLAFYFLEVTVFFTRHLQTKYVQIGIGLNVIF